MLFDHSQELCLKGRLEFPTSSRKNVPAVGKLEATSALHVGSRECPFLMAEQLASRRGPRSAQRS